MKPFTRFPQERLVIALFHVLRHCSPKEALPCLATLFFGAMIALRAGAQTPTALSNEAVTSDTGVISNAPGIWERGVGDGFRPDAQSIGVSAGTLYGFAAFGSVQAHDLALVNLTYGHMLGRVVGDEHWYRGNPEFRLELFTGAQFSPDTDWLVGLTPHLRYDFATGTRWIPFADAGAGVTATGIGPPDLSGIFEFNLQAGGGLQWFLKDDVALSLEAHFVHWSCAGISHPNLGLNGIQGMLGVIFYF